MEMALALLQHLQAEIHPVRAAEYVFRGFRMGDEETVHGRGEFVVRGHAMMRKLVYEEGGLRDAGECERLFELPFHASSI